MNLSDFTAPSDLRYTSNNRILILYPYEITLTSFRDCQWSSHLDRDLGPLNDRFAVRFRCFSSWCALRNFWPDLMWHQYLRLLRTSNSLDANANRCLRRKIKVILVIAYVQHLIWDGTFLYWPLIISLPFLTDKIQNLNGSQKNGLSIPTICVQGHKAQMSTPWH